MQFIDFTKEHFTKDDATENYSLKISKDEVGYGDIEVLEKQDYDTYTKAEYEISDDINEITITVKNPGDIRVSF